MRLRPARRSRVALSRRFRTRLTVSLPAVGLHWFDTRVLDFNARRVAYDALLRAESPGDFLEHRLDADPNYQGLQPEDRRLTRELASGVLRNCGSLDWLISRKTEGRTQKPKIQALLRLGAYQLFFLDRIPDHAAVNETVALARSVGLTTQAGFINAILRGLIREREVLRADLEGLKVSDPAIGWSHPAWLIERWTAHLTTDELQALLRWNNAAPRTFARVNRLKIQPPQLLELWSTEGIEALPCDFPWVAKGTVFELKSHPPIESIPSFKSGGFYIQDPSTLMAVDLLEVKPGDRVLDFCAAPGGKTSLIAEHLNGNGNLVAADSNPDRLNLLIENTTRLGFTKCRVTTSEEAGSDFDRVLVDAPCSNTGVLRRRIELRWRIRPTELTRLASLQSSILDNAAQRVRHGGVLVYSTCSLEPEENREVAHAFIERHPDFKLTKITELHPVRDGVDGAFAARFERLEESQIGELALKEAFRFPRNDPHLPPRAVLRLG